MNQTEMRVIDRTLRNMSRTRPWTIITTFSRIEEVAALAQTPPTDLHEFISTLFLDVLGAFLLTLSHHDCHGNLTASIASSDCWSDLHAAFMTPDSHCSECRSLLTNAIVERVKHFN